MLKQFFRETKNPFLKIGSSAVFGFIENKGFDKASTLTFYTLLAIIPLLAIGFGIAQYLGFEEKFIEQVKLQFASQPQVAEKLIQFAESTLSTTKGGFLASLGVLALFWTVIKTIGNIEAFFNEIWKVEKPRSLLTQIKSYLPVIVLFPVFIVGASSTMVWMSSTVLGFLDFLGPVILLLFNLLSYLISWTLLSLLYIYLPNTHVKWKSGFIAGIVTGLIFFAWQWVYVTFQVQASSYGTIYGAFAALPLFLLWLNYSWMIIIFGARVAFTVNRYMGGGR